MRCREKRLRVGQTVTLKNSYNSYWLPEGLQDGSTATVKAHGCGGLTVEQGGKEWHITSATMQT